MTPATKFDQANKNFKKIYRSRGKLRYGKKYRFLHNWVLNKSEYLLHDDKAYNSNKKVYQRGAIVNVDFGVNVGMELSGNHFAIVLNKHDSKHNDKLTVIPLSSHEHPHTVQLEQTIRDSSQKKINNHLTEIARTLYSIYFILVNARNKISDTQTDPKIEFFKSIPKEASPLFKLIIHDITDNFVTEEDAVNQIKKSNSSHKNLEEITLDYSNSEILLDVAKVTLVMQKYTNYNKVTYAKIEDISTISKSRLRKINEFDPIGEIRVSSSVLDTIDSEINKLFTSI